MSAILEHLPCICTDPAPLRTPSMSRNRDRRAVQFELERRACQSLREVLQLKLKQRQSREELVNGEITTPLKSSAACHEEKQSLEPAETEDFSKRNIRKRPESPRLERHIQGETPAVPSLQGRQVWQQKRARLTDDLDDRISHQLESTELIYKNIQPVPSSVNQEITDSQLPEVSGGYRSCDEDSGYSLSPEQPVNPESSCVLFSLASPPEILTGGSIPSSTRTSLSSPSLTVTNGMAPSDQRAFVTAQSKPQLKSNSDCSAQKEKKLKDDKPKMKKLKYHQYVPPDQKGVKEPSAHLDSSYAKMVHQQQLVLQLQIINQQQQNYHAILPATAKPQSDQQSSSSSSSDSTTSSSSSLSPVSAPSNQESQKHQGSAPRMEIKPASLPPNLHEMKVAELKSELRLRRLPVSGTKTDIIERLKTYQDLKGGSDTTASSTAGGTTGLMAGEAGKPSKTAATTTIIINNNTSQRQQQPHRHRYQIDQSGRSDTTASFSPTSVSLTSSDCSSGSLSPAETGFKCDQTKETMSSPHTQLSLQACSAALFPANIKKEQMCSTSAPCQFFLKPACLQKRCPVSSAGTNAMKKAPVVTMDKDEMLKEKDKQIEELSRMLRQIQRVVELLKMQLERGKRERKVPEPLVFVRVKQEPPDEPSDPLLFHDQPSTPSPSFPCGIEVKQEGRAAEEVVSVPDAHEFTQTLTQTREVQEQIHLKIQPDQTNTVTKHLHLQQTTQRSSQHQAVQRHLLQQRHNSMSWEQLFQNCSQMLDNQPNLQKLPEEKKKSHKQQQQQQQLSRQCHQQLKQQISPKQQEENKQRTQQLQVLTKTQPQQQQVLQLPPQVPEANFDQQSGSPSLFSPFKKDSSPSGNIPLLVKTGGLQVSVDHTQHEVALPLSAPKPVSKEISVTGMNTFLSSSTNNEMCLNMDVLSGPTAQTSMKTWESSPHNKVGELTNGFIDSILQTGGPSQDSPDSDPSISPCLYPPQSSPSAQPEFRTLEDTTKEKQDISHGRLEDFLESTMGNPLLGVEPGCTLTLIDDLHSQMLCTPSILDHPSSPMDTFDKAAKEEQGLDSMDWLDFDVGGLKGSEAMTLDPLGPHTPPGVFSTDFLDSSDLQVQWDSCF